MNQTIKKMFGGLLAASVAAVGLAAVAAPSVTVNSVTESGTWSTIAVKYTLSGVDTTADYKVQFDVTADGVTKTTSDSKAKKSNTSYTKTIDTKSLFGSAKRDAKAKVKVSLVEVKLDWPSAEPIQLWAGGPTWATCNVGASKPEEYGNLYTYDNRSQGVPSGWRVPTKAELQDLVNNCDRKWTPLNGVDGYLVTGKGDYSSNSIFLPAAGYDGGSGLRDLDGENGNYWSSTSGGSWEAWFLHCTSGSFNVCNEYRDLGFSVRAVHD